MPTLNKIDMLNCCRGWHDFSDGATECLVCGAGEHEASAPNATGLATHHGIVPPPSPSMQEHPLGAAASRRRRHADQTLRAAAPDMLAALHGYRTALRSVPGFDPFSHGPLATADTLAEMAIAAAEGRSNG